MNKNTIGQTVRVIKTNNPNLATGIRGVVTGKRKNKVIVRICGTEWLFRESQLAGV
jgi:RNase P/RNase MRP subunit p29